MKSTWFTRHQLTHLVVALLLMIGLFLPVSAVFAEPAQPPGPNPDVKTYIPKPKGTPNDAPAQTTTDQQSVGPALNGTTTNIPKPKLAPANQPAAPNAATGIAWSVSMTVSNSAPQVNTGFTLTATANQDVGPTPYYIQIVLGTTQYASCGFGTTCSVTLSSSQAGAIYYFQARIADSAGNNVQAWSYSVSVKIYATWAINLVVSPANPNINQNYTLTAYTNQDVGPTPYWIEIYWSNSAPRAICGTGTSCSVTLSWPFAQGVQYQARVSNYDGSNIQVRSNNLTVNVQLPSSARLSTPSRPFPFETQIGSANVAGSGSMNCGPASIAMVINYWKGDHTETAKAAAVAIRAPKANVDGQLGTDFEDTPSLNLLAQFQLFTNRAVTTYDYMRQEIASGHPVIMLVNNNAYRSNSPAPYPQLGNGAWTTRHIVVVTGYDQNYVYINDPLRQVVTQTPSPWDYAVPVAMFKNAASTTGQTSTSTWYAMSVYR